MIGDQIKPGQLNIVSHATAKKIIHEVMDDMANIKSTLGPGGKANLVHDPQNMELYPSKAGFRLVMGMKYDNYFHDTILKIVRDTSEHNNEKIGDATTSAIVILDKFYKMLEEKVEEHADGFEHISPTGVTNILNALKFILKQELIKHGYVKFLKDYPVEKQKEIVKKVATIAANNDKTIGEYVARLFDRVIERGKGEELYTNVIENFSRDTDETSEVGFRLNAGLIHRIYATERDGRTATYEDPYYLLIEGALMARDIEPVWPVIQYCCLEQGKPLVIIAGDFVGEFAQNLYALRSGGMQVPNPQFDHNNPSNPKNRGVPPTVTLPPLDILPIQYMTDNDYGHENMVDLEIALGGKLIPALTEHWDHIAETESEMINILGRSKKIISVPHDTSIIGGRGETSKIEGRIADLQENLNKIAPADTPTAAMDEEDYRVRIGMLNSNMVTIRVGGATHKERQYNKLVYEDAIYATKSTIKNGFTLAGQVSIQHLIKKHKEELVDAVIAQLKKEGRNVTFGANRAESLAKATAAILDIISETFKTAYVNAIENAIFDETERKNIIDEIYDDKKENPVSYNLMTDIYEGLDIENGEMFVAGNTDYETFAAITEITNLFLNCENLETLFIPRLMTKEESEIAKNAREAAGPKGPILPGM